MIWFDNIADLQFYHQPKGVPCYCDIVAYPQDLFLQGQINNGNGNYTLMLYVYSADGNTQYEDATTYFDYYFAKVPGVAYHIFTARLKSFSPAMCAHECYILRAEVIQNDGVTVFNKYTERYCQNNCCDVARNITITQTGFSPLIISNDPAADTLFPDVVLPDTTPGLFVPAGNCGEQLIRIISKFDCIDKFTGDFYGTPDEVLSGSADFEYRKITTFRGRMVRRPREIKREISYNCKLQRVESAPQYLLEGFEYMPSWKMYEIEGQLHANRIFVDDFGGVREYHYAGGKPFRQVSKCFELFKLEATLEDCTQRQVFGCKPGCETKLNFDGSNMVFAIPATYSGGGFFNSNKDKIANDYDGLMDYFSTRDGVSGVSDVNMEDMNCSAYKLLSITSVTTPEKLIYFDAPVPNNKIFGTVVSDINDLCSNLPAVCIVSGLGVWTVTEPVCATPVNGVFIVEDTDTDEVAIAGYGDWIADPAETSGAIYDHEVTFSLSVSNSNITEDPDDPGEPILVGDLVGIVGTSGRPQTMIVLNSYNSTLAEGITLTIDNAGRITYYGPTTTAGPDNVTIQLNNITYNI